MSNKSASGLCLAVVLLGLALSMLMAAGVVVIVVREAVRNL